MVSSESLNKLNLTYFIEQRIFVLLAATAIPRKYHPSCTTYLTFLSSAHADLNACKANDLHESGIKHKSSFASLRRRDPTNIPLSAPLQVDFLAIKGNSFLVVTVFFFQFHVTKCLSRMGPRKAW